MYFGIQYNVFEEGTERFLAEGNGLFQTIAELEQEIAQKTQRSLVRKRFLDFCSGRWTTYHVENEYDLYGRNNMVSVYVSAPQPSIKVPQFSLYKDGSALSPPDASIQYLLSPR